MVPLLPVEQKNALSRALPCAAPRLHGPVGMPQQEVTCWMGSVQRLDEDTNLIARPNIPALKFRQKQLAV